MNVLTIIASIVRIIYGILHMIAMTAYLKLAEI
jgi:hypothetical protein